MSTVVYTSHTTKGVVRMPKGKITGQASGRRGVAKKPATMTSGKKKPVKAGEKPYVRFSDKLAGGLEDISQIIEENKATMDSIQEIGLALASAARALQAMASKYVSMVDRLLDTAVPILRNIPLVPKQTMKTIENLQNLANNILDICTTADKVITDVDAGLRNADVAKLNAHAGDLQTMTKSLQRVLPK
jgi:hypothetical protein